MFLPDAFGVVLVGIKANANDSVCSIKIILRTLVTIALPDT